jgi:hypothetical protein
MGGQGVDWLGVSLIQRGESGHVARHNACEERFVAEFSRWLGMDVHGIYGRKSRVMV